MYQKENELVRPSLLSVYSVQGPLELWLQIYRVSLVVHNRVDFSKLPKHKTLWSSRWKTKNPGVEIDAMNQQPTIPSNGRGGGRLHLSASLRGLQQQQQQGLFLCGRQAKHIQNQLQALATRTDRNQTSCLSTWSFWDREDLLVSFTSINNSSSHHHHHQQQQY